MFEMKWDAGQTHGKKAGKKSTQNHTGIPVQTKSFLESSYGFSLNDVKVHYHSEKPAQLQALAYAQGNEVYVGPGQEKHLPHELMHVIQQKKGMVKPDKVINGVAVNTSKQLEREADAAENIR